MPDEKLNEATQGALRVFGREVEEGKLVDTPQVQDAFTAGWNGLRAYQDARRTLQFNRSALFPLGMLVMMLGLTFSVGVGWLMYLQPHGLRPHAWALIPFGAGLIVVAFLMMRASERRDNAKAAALRAAFEKEWSYPTPQ